MSDLRVKVHTGTIIILVVSLVLAVIVGGLAFRTAQGFFESTTLFNLENTVAIPPEPTAQTAQGAQATPNGTATYSAPPAAVSQAQDVPPPTWDGKSRVTILIMGLDYRDWQTGTDVPRTDTMMLVTIDPLTNTAGLLSIPRDMWVNIPGFGYSRINAAYRTGEMYKLEGGGPALAMKTVEQFIGVPVDYYALIDFNSFIRFIDDIGGLDMKIRTPIKIDPIGPGNTRTLQVGTQTLDGQAVLAYARNRYTQDGDFDRSKRQQEVVIALRNQVVNLKLLPEYIQKAPKIYSDISAGIKTNLTLDQVIRLSVLASKIDLKNIKQGVFDPHKDVQYATVQTTEGAADVLVPNPDQIRLIRDSIFVNGVAYAPVAAGGDLTELMKSEQAKVLLRDGTGNPARYKQAADMLRGLGMQVVGEEATQAGGLTTIIDHSGRPYTTKLIQEKLGLASVQVKNKFDANATVDLEVTIGADYKGQ
jgi:polyisoprenyl-teichoic acid--peptidoglycan teichoic acid transferase